MQDRLRDKAIVIVGSATGIGAATARRLASEGARLALADINMAGAKSLADSLRQAGHEAHAIDMDIADEGSVAAGMQEAIAQFGGLDGAHINAADLRTIMNDSNVLDEGLDVFDRTIAVNLRGHFLCTRAVLPALLKKGGAIVYTSSGACDMGDSERPAYAASKSGLNALMRHVARRYGRDGITANAVAPGFVITEEQEQNGVLDGYIEWAQKQTPNRRLGKGADIAGVVAMLLSEDGRWISGQVFHINGGALQH